MNLWRLSRYESLSGEGGLRQSARWHTVGSPVLYLADHPGSALLEVLVHLEVEDEEIPLDYKYLQVSAPEDLAIALLHSPSGKVWKDNLAFTRHLGDTWLASRISALARVPSAILPATFNYLLNPLHPDAASLQIVASHKASFDRRLLRK